MPLRVAGPDIVTARDKQKINRAIAANTPKFHYGGHGHKVQKRGNDDPVMGFLKSAAKFIGSVPDKAEDVGRAYIKQKKKDFTPQRGGRLQSISDAPHNELAVSPAGLRGILQAGSAAITKPGLLDLNAMYRRIPETTGIRKVPSEKLLYSGDTGPSRRIPWIVNPRSGQVRVGPMGATHAQLYRKNPQTGDWIGDPREWLQGWITNPVSEEATITLGQGRKAGGLLSHKGKEFGAAEGNVNRLLDALLGKDEIVTDDMIRTFKGGLFDVPARQGTRANELLERLGGPMSSKEFEEFMRQELLRRKRKK